MPHLSAAYDNETGQCVHMDFLMEATWYVDEPGNLYIFPEDSHFRGPDTEVSLAFDRRWGEVGGRPLAITAARMGLAVIDDSDKHFHPEEGYYTHRWTMPDFVLKMCRKTLAGEGGMKAVTLLGEMAQNNPVDLLRLIEDGELPGQQHLRAEDLAAAGLAEELRRVDPDGVRDWLIGLLSHEDRPVRAYALRQLGRSTPDRAAGEGEAPEATPSR